MFDIIWLKRDIRLRDQGSIATALNDKRNFLLLYIYKPDQLLHHSVHGSHIEFVNESILDMSNHIKKKINFESERLTSILITTRVGEATQVFQSLHVIMITPHPR